VDVRRPLGGSSDASEDDVGRWRFSEYVVGLALGLVLVALVLAFWYGTRPPEPGLRWGDNVYTSEEQFKEYLEQKGLSYRTWVGRHPGAAPWDTRSG
jgi:hypothetical protein